MTDSTWRDGGLTRAGGMQVGRFLLLKRRKEVEDGRELLLEVFESFHTLRLD